MVRKLTAISLLTLLGAPAYAARFQFKAEFSKPEIYRGEAVNTTFLLIGEEDAVDVEVARFPEFRGYWSENITLRQGPIPLIADFPARLFRSALIGAYRIIPMMQRQSHEMNPMKIVVKSFMDPNGDGRPQELECDIAPLKILPLPPLPADIPPTDFNGAVGHLSVRADSNEIFFQKDEPAQIRISIQGDGNFPEMNNVNLPLPKEIELLSKKAYQSGVAQMMTKTFEYTVVPHAGESFDLPEFGFAWFDPQLKQYQRRTIGPLRFRFEAKPAIDPILALEAVELKATDTEWSEYRALGRTLWFWGLQAAGLAWLGVLAVKEIARRRAYRESLTPRFRWKSSLDEVRELYQSSQWDRMLGRADELAFQWLKELAKLPAVCVRRTDAVRLAQGKVDRTAIDSASTIFEAREKFAFRGIQPPPAPTEAVLKSLEALYGLVA